VPGPSYVRPSWFGCNAGAKSSRSSRPVPDASSDNATTSPCRADGCNRRSVLSLRLEENFATLIEPAADVAAIGQFPVGPAQQSPRFFLRIACNNARSPSLVDDNHASARRLSGPARRVAISRLSLAASAAACDTGQLDSCFVKKATTSSPSCERNSDAARKSPPRAKKAAMRKFVQSRRLKVQG
jgi:hypothetical protein